MVYSAFIKLNTTTVEKVGTLFIFDVQNCTKMLQLSQNKCDDQPTLTQHFTHSAAYLRSTEYFTVLHLIVLVLIHAKFGSVLLSSSLSDPAGSRFQEKETINHTQLNKNAAFSRRRTSTFKGQCFLVGFCAHKHPKETLRKQQEFEERWNILP